jgi:hypothetical protein
MPHESLPRPRETVTRFTDRSLPNVDAALTKEASEQQTLRSLLTRPRIKTVRRIDACTFEVRRTRMTWAQWRTELLAAVRGLLRF